MRTLRKVTFCVFAILLSTSHSIAEDLSLQIGNFELNAQQYGTAKCNGKIIFDSLEMKENRIKSDVWVGIAIEQKGLSNIINSYVNKNVLPFEVKDKGFSVVRLNKLALRPTEEFVSVEAHFDTTGLLNGSQTISLKIRNRLYAGIAARTLLQVIPESVHLKLDGRAYYVLPTSWIWRSKQAEIDRETELTIRSQIKTLITDKLVRNYIPYDTTIKSIKLNKDLNNRYYIIEATASVEMTKEQMNKIMTSNGQKTPAEPIFSPRAAEQTSTNVAAESLWPTHEGRSVRLGGDLATPKSPLSLYPPTPRTFSDQPAMPR